MKKILGLFNVYRETNVSGADAPADIDVPNAYENEMAAEMQIATVETEIEAATGDFEDNQIDPVLSIASVNEELLGASTKEVADNQTRAVAELGERHEMLAARLGQIGEILQQLNDAHKVVDRLVSPLSATFRHHQILAGQNIALQHALDRVNTDASTLREREVMASARASSIELELRHLSDSYAQALAQQSQAEDEARVAVEEVRHRDASISQLERQIHELSTELSELRVDFEQANSRYQEEESGRNSVIQQLRQERESLQALEREYNSLKESLRKAVTEAAQFNRQKIDAEEVAAAAKAHSHEVEKNLAQIQAEKAQIVEKLGELELAMAEDRRNLSIKAESVHERAEALDKMLVQARAELGTQAEALREALHKGSEMENSIIRLENRCEKLTSDLQKREEENLHLSEAHASLENRVAAMTKTIRSKDEALQRNKEVLESQANRLGELEGRSLAQGENHERQLASFAAVLEQERAEKALLEGTLEASRQEKQRLQQQLIQYRSNMVDESSADVVQLSKVTYPTVETLSGLLPKPSLEAPTVVLHERHPPAPTITVAASTEAPVAPQPVNAPDRPESSMENVAS